MNSVSRVKALCKERKIAISRLEKELGFANGYIAQLRKGVFPDDRLKKIAEFFELPLEYFTDSNIKEEIDNEPKVFDIDKELNDLIRKINISDQIAFSGEAVPSELSDTSKTLFLMSIKTILEQQKHLAEQE